MASIRARVGNYQIVETLGVGSFGKVKLATHVATGATVALKFINRAKLAREEGMPARVQREIAILRFLRHPHIIKLYEVLHTPNDLVMVMEYAGDELFAYISERGRMAEDEARRFLQQLVGAVEYCHRHRIVHRDLKPENLLLDASRNLKVADFGLSNTLRDGDFLKTSCGSPNYAAPEVIAGKLYAGPEVDVWSIGVILYVMLVGRLPFDDEYIPSLFAKISQGVFTLPSFLTPEARHLISAMLVVDPLKRISMADIRRHPWFARNLPAYLAPMPPLAVAMHHHQGRGGVGFGTSAGDTDESEDEDPSCPSSGLLDAAVDTVAEKLGLPRGTVVARLLSEPLLDVDETVASKEEEEVELGRNSADATETTTALPAIDDPTARIVDADADDPILVAYRLVVDNAYLWSGRRSENAARDAQWAAGGSPPTSGSLATTASSPSRRRRMEVVSVGAESAAAAAVASSASASAAATYQGSVAEFKRQPMVPPPPPLAPPEICGDASRATAAAQTTPTPAPARKSARSKWHVGIRSRSPPLDVMLELYKALAACGPNMSWKPLGPFALRCRYVFPAIDPGDYGVVVDQSSMDTSAAAAAAGLLGPAAVPVEVKLDIQLFKVDTSYFLVDFKLVSPPLGSASSATPTPTGTSAPTAGTGSFPLSSSPLLQMQPAMAAAIAGGSADLRRKSLAMSVTAAAAAAAAASSSSSSPARSSPISAPTAPNGNHRGSLSLASSLASTPSALSSLAVSLASAPMSSSMPAAGAVAAASSAARRESLLRHRRSTATLGLAGTRGGTSSSGDALGSATSPMGFLEVAVMIITELAAAG